MPDSEIDPMVFLVSYPRSGQHFSQKLLENSSGRDEYCEYYNCWEKDCPAQKFPTRFRVPCYSGKRIQKNHDFEGDLPYAKQFRYAVLYRNPVLSIQSFYEWCLRNLKGVQIYKGQQKIVVPDSIDAWRVFAEQKAVYWRDFVQKWVLKNARANVGHFPYESLVSDTDEMRRFVKFCTPSVTDSRLQSAIDTQVTNLQSGNRSLRDAQSFRYPAPEIADKIREVTGPSFNRLYP